MKIVQHYLNGWSYAGQKGESDNIYDITQDRAGQIISYNVYWGGVNYYARSWVTLEGVFPPHFSLSWVHNMSVVSGEGVIKYIGSSILKRTYYEVKPEAGKLYKVSFYTLPELAGELKYEGTPGPFFFSSFSQLKVCPPDLYWASIEEAKPTIPQEVLTAMPSIVREKLIG